MMNVKLFENLCVKMIGSRVNSFKFTLFRTFSRPRGVVTEFRRNNESIILAWEEDELVVDIILCVSASEWVRISVNQFLWFNNVKTLIEALNCKGKLKVVSKEISSLLGGELENKEILDPRYCYRMNGDAYLIYMNAQEYGMGIDNTQP